MKQEKYPYIKIIVSFTLAPTLVSFIVGFFSGASVLAEGIDKLSSAVAIIFITGILGGIYFCIPAFILSILYAALRLYKVWYSFLLVTIVGGSAAHLWAAIIWGNEESIQSDITNTHGLFFVLGALSSLLVAYFILPRRPTEPTKGEHE